MILTYNIIYSAMKKNEIMPFAAKWMNLEITILSVVSQTSEDKYHTIHLIWTILKNDTNLFTKQKQNHRLKRTNLCLGRGKTRIGID